MGIQGRFGHPANFLRLSAHGNHDEGHDATHRR